MRTIHQRHTGWDNALPPVAEIESGDELEFDVVDASGGQLARDSTAATLGALDFARVNPVTGPVFVRGARPGDVLEVEIRALTPSGWGWTGIIPGFGLLADEYPAPWLAHWQIDGGIATGLGGVRVPIRPFPGTIGVALPEPGAHSIVPPRRNGGNMDIKHLVAGARLLLPVLVEGALFSVGDTHAAQGDGEVCGTAIESPMTVTLRITLRRGRSLPAPEYVLPPPSVAPPDPAGYHVTTGIASDLLEAAREATRHAVAYLQVEHGFTREEAYVLASVCVDLRISEVVDAPNWLVSAVVPLSIVSR
ncbi:MAG: acetamidase [Dehalococcoidia bacterium]|nr:MAG: acetamidase [Dehalococcoidia bacterium]